VEISQLRAFLAVAKYQHITKAARDLGCSQPYLSNVIGSLESDLGIRLFDRIGRNIVLNNAGKLLQYHAQIVCGEIDTIYRQAEALKNAENDTIRFSASGPRFAKEIISRFSAISPNTHYLQQIQDKKEAERAILEHYITFALCSPPVIHKDIETFILCDEEIYLAVPQSHPLAKREIVRLSEIKDEPFLSLSNNYSFYKILSEFFEEAGFSFNPVVQVDQMALYSVNFWDNLLQFIPESLIDSSYSMAFKFIHVVEPKLHRQIGLSYLKNRTLSPNELNFRQIVFNYFEKEYIKREYDL